MTTSRWEKERADWLRARAKTGSGRQRRYELLDKRRREQVRRGAGVSGSAQRESITPWLGARLRKANENDLVLGGPSKILGLLSPLILLAGAIVLSGAIAITAAIYGALWYLSPRIGRLAWTPWVVVGVIWGGIGVLVHHDVSSILDVSVWPRYFVVDLDTARALGAWLWLQLAAGLIATGVWIRENGWLGVPDDAVKPIEKNADGSYRETPEDQLIRLGEMVGLGEDDDEREESPAPAQDAEQDKAESTVIAETAFDDEPAPTDFYDPSFDDDPVFDDEPIFDDITKEN